MFFRTYMYLNKLCFIAVPQFSQRNGVGRKILQTTNNFSHPKRNLAEDLPVLVASCEVILNFDFE